MEDKSKNNWLKLNHNCVLCALSSSQPICQGCYADLPWLENYCTICSLPLTARAEKSICRNCLTKRPHFDHVIAAFHYHFPLNRILPKTKKEQNRHHFKWLAQCVVQKIKERNTQQTLPQVLIAVPIAKTKTLLKGYNQAAEFAQHISHLMRIPLAQGIVIKNKNTPAQAELSAKQRRSNLRHAFSVNPHQYQHVAIIDDVLTTGSTADEIAKVLKSCGVKTVQVWVIARTPL